MKTILLALILLSSEAFAYGPVYAPPPAQPIHCYTVKTSTGWATQCR